MICDIGVPSCVLVNPTRPHDCSVSEFLAVLIPKDTRSDLNCGKYNERRMLWIQLTAPRYIAALPGFAFLVIFYYGPYCF